MKKLLFIIFIAFSIICQAQTSQFEKPRYLKYATLVCPIDMTKSYSSEGIIAGNKFSITTTKKYQYVIEDSAGKRIISNKELMDTTLTKTILIEKGWAFDVVQQIGSFSIIKFWNLNTRFYKKQPKKQNTILNKDFEITKVEGLIATIRNTEYDLSMQISSKKY